MFNLSFQLYIIISRKGNTTTLLNAITIDATSNLFTCELRDLKILPSNLLAFVKTKCSAVITPINIRRIIFVVSLFKKSFLKLKALSKWSFVCIQNSITYLFGRLISLIDIIFLEKMGLKPM